MLISGEKVLMPTEVKGYVAWFIYFLDLLWERYNCAKFHHFRMYVTDFREGYLFNPYPHPWADTKRPILNRVNKVVGQEQGKCVNERTITLSLPPKNYLQAVYLHSMYYLLGDMPWSRFHMPLNLKKSFQEPSVINEITKLF